jgi:hypothetical protein
MTNLVIESSGCLVIGDPIMASNDQITRWLNDQI